MAKLDSKEQYNKLFQTNEDKAKAFDQIADIYYDRNFGAASKSDIDVLMFSIYLDKILERSREDMNTYSDYILSKYLGITQSKVKNLKIRKELVYPNDDFEWKNAFKRIYDTAQYKDGNIVLYVPDPNLYIELKHFVEQNQGLVDVKRNSYWFVVSLEYFLDLIVYVASDEEKNIVKKHIKNKFIENQVNVENFERQPIAKTLKENASEILVDAILEELSNVPGISSISVIVKKTIELLKESKR